MKNEIEVRKSFSDEVREGMMHDDILEQNEKFHQEKLAQQEKFNEASLKLQKEIDEANEKRHGKSLIWTKRLVIANIILVIATIFMAGAGIWNATETRRLANAEFFPDFDFKVTTTPNPINYNGVEEVKIKRNEFPYDINFYVEIFNSGKIPVKLNSIILTSECINLPSSTIAVSPIPSNKDIVPSGQKLEYGDLLTSKYLKNQTKFPCEIYFTANTNRLSKSVKIILK